MGSCSQAWNYCRWKYAGNSVLEVHIRRRTRMWSWSNIKQHRQLLKSYKNVYKNKLIQSKLSEETQRQIQVWALSLWRNCILVPLWNNSLEIIENNPQESARDLWKYLFNLKYCVTCSGKQNKILVKCHLNQSVFGWGLINMDTYNEVQE